MLMLIYAFNDHLQLEGLQEEVQLDPSKSQRTLPTAWWRRDDHPDNERSGEYLDRRKRLRPGQACRFCSNKLVRRHRHCKHSCHHCSLCKSFPWVQLPQLVEVGVLYKWQVRIIWQRTKTFKLTVSFDVLLLLVVLLVRSSPWRILQPWRPSVWCTSKSLSCFVCYRWLRNRKHTGSLLHMHRAWLQCLVQLPQHLMKSWCVHSSWWPRDHQQKCSSMDRTLWLGRRPWIQLCFSSSHCFVRKRIWCCSPFLQKH